MNLSVEWAARIQMVSGREGSDPIGVWHSDPSQTCQSAQTPRSLGGSYVMSNIIARDDPSLTVLVGVDTHKTTRVAVAINGLDTRLATPRATANLAGYAELLPWARPLGTIDRFLRCRPRQLRSTTGLRR